MLSQVNKLKSKFSKDLFEYLKTTPINTIYGGLEAHPSVNDMNWASYFATYNTKYLDNIIENLRYVSEKQDLQKYLTGISAKWSLCVNAKSYPQIKEYLEQQESYKKIIKQLLKKEPEEIDKEMESFLKLQKAKGIW